MVLLIKDGRYKSEGYSYPFTSESSDTRQSPGSGRGVCLLYTFDSQSFSFLEKSPGCDSVCPRGGVRGSLVGLVEDWTETRRKVYRLNGLVQVWSSPRLLP